MPLKEAWPQLALISAVQSCKLAQVTDKAGSKLHGPGMATQAAVWSRMLKGVPSRLTRVEDDENPQSPTDPKSKILDGGILA